MMIYTYSSSKKKKKKLTKDDKKLLTDYNSWRLENNLPLVDTLKTKKMSKKFTEYAPRVVHKNSTAHIPSLESNEPAICARTSIMDRINLDKESESVKEQILTKSKRIAQMYSKGGYQYIPDEIDITTIGTRSRRM